MGAERESRLVGDPVGALLADAEGSAISMMRTVLDRFPVIHRLGRRRSARNRESAAAASTAGGRVVLLADLHDVDGPRESGLVRSGESPLATSTRRVASILHWVSSSTCWQRTTPSFPPPLTLGPSSGRTAWGMDVNHGSSSSADRSTHKER